MRGQYDHRHRRSHGERGLSGPLILSIRQPWAWLIVNGWKDIENRDWPTNVRDRILIHAGKSMTRDEYDDACDFARPLLPEWVQIPAYEALERGGIVGEACVVDCVDGSPSRWFVGRYGFVLAGQRSLPFRPMRGQLVFFRESMPLPPPA